MLAVDENVVVQIFLVLVTIAAIIVTGLKMRESNNLLKSEFT